MVWMEKMEILLYFLFMPPVNYMNMKEAYNVFIGNRISQLIRPVWNTELSLGSASVRLCAHTKVRITQGISPLLLGWSTYLSKHGKHDHCAMITCITPIWQWRLTTYRHLGTVIIANRTSGGIPDGLRLWQYKHCWLLWTSGGVVPL